MRRLTAAVSLCAVLAAGSLALAGCSSSSGGGGSSSSGGGGGATPTATATASPTTVEPSPSGTVKGITFSVTSTVSSPTDRIGVSLSTDASFSGKQVAIIKTTDGNAKVIASGMTVASDGSASGWVYLQQSGDLQAVIADKPLSDGAFDKATALLAESGTVSITIS